jgi:hypothetical protein
MIAAETIIPTSPGTDSVIERLIGMSHAKPTDIEDFVHWDVGVDRSRLPKPERHSWIYGTHHWDGLSEAQRMEVLWDENARDITMFILLEQYIPVLYTGYINTYRDQITPTVYEYLMIFCKEELVHILAFRRYMKMANLELYNPPAGYARLFDRLPQEHPIIGILFVLCIEWMAELAAMHNVRNHDVDPLTKEIYLVHHEGEVRHIGFGRRIVESFFEVAPPEMLTKIREMVRNNLEDLFAQFTYKPEIADRVSFKFPIASNDEEEIAKIRSSDHNRQINQERFGELYAWLGKLELMGSVQ